MNGTAEPPVAADPNMGTAPNVAAPTPMEMAGDSTNTSK